MNKINLILARRGNEDVNNWLDKNPLVLGLIFLVIGAALLGSGIYELKKGVARDKYGNKIPGSLGQFTSIVRIVLGAGLIIFALYRMVAG